MFGPLEIRMGPYGSTCVTVMRFRVAKTAQKCRNISKEQVTFSNKSNGNWKWGYASSVNAIKQTQCSPVFMHDIDLASIETAAKLTYQDPMNQHNERTGKHARKACTYNYVPWKL